MKYYFNFFFIFLFISKAFTQSPSLEFKAKYSQAKLDLKNKKYELAKTGFLNLKSTSTSPVYSPYISYFLSLTFFHTNEIQLAENQLVNIQNNYPNWDKINEVNFQLGLVYFAKKETEKALYNFNKISLKSFEKDIDLQITKHFKSQKIVSPNKIWVEKFTNLKTLKSLNNESEAINIYDLKPSEIPILQPKPKANYTKNYFNFGLLLPFHADSAMNESSQYVYDMYEGMLLAVEKLKSENISIKINAYDVGNNKNKLLQLLNNLQFLENEILIGPLYQETNKIIQYYANERKVTLINPLSKNKQLIDNKPFSFLNKASNYGFAKQAVKFAANNFLGESAIIFDKNDSLATKLVAEELKKNGTKYTLIKYTNAESLSPYLKKKFGSIYLIINPKNSLNAISNIEKKYGIVPIITHNDFLPNQLQFNASNSPELYIFNQDYIDEESESIKKFKLEYWESRNNLASIYTMKGYDMMLFWGRQIGKYKQNHIDMVKLSSFDDDYLVNNFNYSLLPNENAAFIITTIQNGVEAFYRKF